jgi:hypothetical protein
MKNKIMMGPQLNIGDKIIYDNKNYIITNIKIKTNYYNKEYKLYTTNKNLSFEENSPFHLNCKINIKTERKNKLNELNKLSHNNK